MTVLGSRSRGLAFGIASLLAVLGTGQEARAEGSGQIGPIQHLQEFDTVNEDNAVFVDTFAGEWINISACGDNDARPVRFQLLDPNGATVIDVTQPGNVACNDPMTAPLTTPLRHQATLSGAYEIRLTNTNAVNSQAATSLFRFDVTVTTSDLTNPDPTGATGITGRVFSKKWQYLAGSFAETNATDADYFVLTPGGVPNTNYVWKLDFNNMAGYGYDVVANGIGVDDAPSFSVPQAGNSVTPLYDLYLAYPGRANPPPVTPPSISNFRFADDLGQDIVFSPGSTVGVQDSGTFSFETDIADATFAIAIDTGGPGGSGPDGIYGGEGDVFLNGYTVIGTNSAVWDGTDVLGNPVPPGNYTAELSVRLGEFHFVGADIETSGGGPFASNPANAFGLTIWEVTTSGSLVPTLVYYDDETLLNASTANPAVGPSNPAITLPGGAYSGTPAGYHTWGNFAGDGFGNVVFIDTFVFGRTRTASTSAVVSTTDGPPTGNFTGFVQIDATTVGGPASLLIADQDLIGAGTVTGTVTNGRTGDTVTVTLTEDPAQPGNFLFDMPTKPGATSGGTLGVAPADVLTLTYNDAANGSSVPQTITDMDTVGGTDGVPLVNAGIVGDPVQLSVDDADIAGTGTLVVDVVNERTGETETVTLTETGPSTGIFTAQLNTVAGAAPDGTAGLMAVQSADLIRLDYDDALRENGTTQTVSDNDPVKSGTPALTSIDAVVVGEPVTFTVVDGDRAGSGTIQATVENLDTGETETVTLTERPGSPGVFDGTVATLYGTTPNGTAGTFAADAGDVFEIRYDDVARPMGSPAQVSATDPIAGGVPGTPSITASVVGGDLTLSVTDADLAGDGTLVVGVRNDRTGEIETVTLTEGAAGTFGGTLPTTFGAASDGNGSNGSINAAAGDVMTIIYDDALTANGSPQTVTDTDTMTGGNDGTPTIDATTVGQPVQLTVTDPDLTGPSVDVIVTNPSTGESETVTLTGGPGSYAGQVLTAYGTIPNGAAGTFAAASGDVFEIAYVDVLASDGSSPTRTATDPIAGGNTAVPVINADVVGQPLQLTVTDPDLAGDGTLTVTVRNETTLELETVVLTETGTGIFTGTLATTYGNASDGNGTNGSINAAANDDFTLTVTDTFQADGSSGPVSATDPIAGGIDAIAAIVATSVGNTVALSVNDADRAGDGTLSVNVRNVDTGEIETVILTEGGTPGLFEGTVGTEFGNTPDARSGIFAAQAGHTFEITYDEPLAADGSMQTRIATDPIAGGTDGTPAIDATTVGATVALQVTDPDRAGDGTIDVTVRNVDTGGSETVTLTETGPGTGIFAGTVATAFGNAPDGSANGSINADNGDVFEIAYADPQGASGGLTTLTATDPIAGGVTGVPTIAATTPGQPATLSVDDADLAGTGTLTVIVRNLDTLEDETVTLTEVGGTGVFNGTLPTAFGAISDGAANGSINGDAGDTLAILYDDALRTDGSSGTETDTAVLTGGSDGTPSIAATTVGQPLTLGVSDPDLAALPSITVTVENVDIPGETETVTLTATGGGNFAGTLPTAFGTTSDGNPANGSINGDAGDTFRITYADALTSTGGTASPTATDTIGGGNDGTPAIVATLVGQPLTLGVSDPDLAALPSITVTVENVDIPGETETVTLTATGGGNFAGTLPTAFGTTPDGNSADGSINGDAGDTFRITYADALTSTGGTASPTATDTIGGGNDGTPSIVAGTVGQPLQLAVSDPDLAALPSITVTVENTSIPGETETVTLTATGGGNFAGTLPTAFGTTPDGNPANGSINGATGHGFVITYNDAFSSTGGPATPTATDTIGGGATGTVQIVAGPVGQPVQLTLTDADLAGNGTQTVTVTNPGTGEVETVTLIETVPGVFEASLPTVFGNADDGVPGQIAVVAGQPLEIAYSDALLSSGGTGTATDQDAPTGGADGVVTLSASTPGSPLIVTLTDADLAGNGTQTVTLTNPSTGETETVTLTEGGTPGTFTATLPTVFGNVDDGVPGQMAVAAGDVIAASYADGFTTTGGTGTATDDATIGSGDTGVVTIGATVPGAPATITLTDADLAGNGTQTVTVTNPSTGETETVTLTEGGTPGTFTATLPTVFGNADDGVPGQIAGAAGDTLSVTYDDALTNSGAPGTATDSAPLSGGTLATVSVTPTLVGQPVALSVTDPDLVGAGTLSVTVTNIESGEVETVTLTENPGAPGTFEGTVATSYGLAPDATPGTFAASSGDRFEIAYDDPLDASGAPRTVTDVNPIAGGADGVASATGAPVGQPATFEVTDPDIAGQGTLDVTITNPATGESETLTLVEGTPGTFGGTMPTVFGTADDGVPGQMAAAAGDVLTLTYDDALRANGSTGPVTADAAMTGGTDGVPTIAAPAVDSPIALSVTDPDIAGSGTLVVTVTNGTTGEVETVTLTEDPGSPGTFDGTLASAYGIVAGPDDGTMLAAGGDVLTISYPDAFRADGSSGPVTAPATIGGGTTGVVTIDPAPVGQNQPITVTDPDLTGQTTITVTVTNPDTGGTQTVTLTVDPGDPTLFTGGVPTTFGTVDDGDPLDASLPVTSTSVLTVSYADALSGDGSPQTLTDTATPLGGTDAVPSTPGGTVGAPVPLAVVDPDLAGSGAIVVTVTNPATGESESVVLNENPGVPGTFEGTVATTFGTTPGAPGDGSLNAQAGDTLVIDFDDPFGASGGVTPVTASGPLSGGTTAVVSITPAPVGTPTPITVTDPDLVGQGTLTVLVTSPTGDAETVTLTEDPGNPGTFTGTVATVLPPVDGPPNTGTLAIEPGQPISVAFDDPISTTGAPITVTDTGPMPNLDPTAADDSVATPPGVAVSVPVLLNDDDPEGAQLTITGVAAPPASEGTVTTTPTGTLVFTPAPGFTGLSTFTYTVSDPHGGSVTATVSVNVDAAAPTATADAATTMPDVPVVIDVLANDTDPDGQPLTVSAILAQSNGTATILPDGTVEFTPAPGFIGQATFTYEITDADGLTDTATVTVDVDPSPFDVADDTGTTPFATPVTLSVLVNDTGIQGGSARIVRVTQGANGVVTFDGGPFDPLNPGAGGGTINYMPDPGFYGTDTFTYETCDAAGRCGIALVTVTVEEPPATLTGKVWRDNDHDRVFDDGAEPPLGGWTVEVVDAGGDVAGTGTTGTDGNYAIAGLVPGSGYSVRFTHPESGVVWDEIENVTLNPGLTTADQSLPVDPSGVVYDAVTRLPIAGATVTITDAAGTPLPPICLLDPSQQNQVVADDGYYRFDVFPRVGEALCPPVETEYRLQVTGPGGTPTETSASIPAEPGAFDPTGLTAPVEIVPAFEAPQGGEATTYYLAFLIAPGDPDVVNNHLPLDIAPRTGLVVTKAALMPTVSAGRAVPYRITVVNPEPTAFVGVTVVDLLPEGFRYQDGSSAIDGVPVDARVRGRDVQYRGLTIPAGGELTVSLVAVAGSLVQEGEFTNRAFVRSDVTGEIVSTVGTATVRHEPDPDFDCSPLIGRVFVDDNGNGQLDAGEEGLPNVRLATVNGVLVRTGSRGRYHLPCAAVPNETIGSTFVLKLDERTLPLGFSLETLNPQTVRLTRGKMAKINFAVSRLAEVRLDFSSAAFEHGSTRLRPEYRAALAGLIQTLSEQRSRLVLVYHAQSGEIGGRERMRSVAAEVQRAWKERGSPYGLSIERSVERDLVLGAPRLVTKG